MSAGKSTRDQVVPVHVKVRQGAAVSVEGVQNIHTHGIPVIGIINDNFYEKVL